MNKRMFLIIISICLLTELITFGCYKMVVTTKQRRYNETPLIAEIEERSKLFILDRWIKSGVDLEFVTQELIGENTLVYYFKVVEPEYFYVYGVREHYVKAVYKFQGTGILLKLNKSWQFDVVWTSSYKEIQTVLEVQDE